MTYLKWKLSDDGTWGTGPEETIADRGGRAEASAATLDSSQCPALSRSGRFQNAGHPCL